MAEAKRLEVESDRLLAQAAALSGKSKALRARAEAIRRRQSRGNWDGSLGDKGREGASCSQQGSGGTQPPSATTTTLKRKLTQRKYAEKKRKTLDILERDVEELRVELRRRDEGQASMESGNKPSRTELPPTASKMDKRRALHDYRERLRVWLGEELIRLRQEVARVDGRAEVMTFQEI